MRPERIISGGQTGADRGGLEAAIALGIPHGGWCPRGRRAEDGPIPEKYELRETMTSDYRDRTFRNIADSDATIVFAESSATAGPGTRLTLREALELRKPILFVQLMSITSAKSIRQWLKRYKPNVLNIAGSRESTTPGIEQRVKDLLIEVLS